MNIIGIKYCGHDSAFVWIDTKLQTVHAESCERITRIKHDWISVPYALKKAGLDGPIQQIAHSFLNIGSGTSPNHLDLIKVSLECEVARNLEQPTFLCDVKIRNSPLAGLVRVSDPLFSFLRRPPRRFHLFKRFPWIKRVQTAPLPRAEQESIWKDFIKKKSLALKTLASKTLITIYATLPAPIFILPHTGGRR